MRAVSREERAAAVVRRIREIFVGGTSAMVRWDVEALSAWSSGGWVVVVFRTVYDTSRVCGVCLELEYYERLNSECGFTDDLSYAILVTEVVEPGHFPTLLSADLGAIHWRIMAEDPDRRIELPACVADIPKSGGTVPATRE
ncbi:MAG: hypothetical protein QM809_06545 [Gordonia sp. (in: high G+C Gram-positive bacteria)]|uniref:hypothetical protein n=1 Tax=Gordonia sp. (in: high G+C Gram-positive bacteria) TaxID=84139 RepID=UPI0039E4AD80